MTSRDICSLDYLVGTLATAYKGLITSLIAKDFCITEEDDKVALRGTILSMPAGDYRAFLKRGGIELSRAEILQGHFEISANPDVFRESKNLQIDIMQNGRHIGTFLLKRVGGDDLFVSALQLSEEVRGIHFKHLFARLLQKPGLLKHAEDIAAKIFSTKKDWKKFSEDIHTFSRDLFWYDRESYYLWFELLSKYALTACERIGGRDGSKPVENYLSLIELPLASEQDADRIRSASAVWLKEMEASGTDFSPYYRGVIRVLADIYERFGAGHITSVLRRIFFSLKAKAVDTPVIPVKVIEMLRPFLEISDLDMLRRYNDAARDVLFGAISSALNMTDAGRYEEVFEKALAIDTAVLDDVGMTDSFFEVVLKNTDRSSSESMALTVSEMFAVFETMPHEVYKRAMIFTADLIKKMLGLGICDVCRKLLLQLEGKKEAEDIILNPGVAEAVLAAGNLGLLASYKAYLTGIIIPSPGIRGFSGDTWAEIINPLHLERLSKFLKIISIDGAGFREVLIHVVCNLHVSGIFIPDDRLFQREVSEYLNSGVLRSDFLLHYMLLKRLPVYYNEVGAMGVIRDFTTELDSWGNDTVLYFLRKQVHVNASNHNIQLIEQVMRAWVDKNTDPLKQVVPEDVLVKFDVSLLEKYSEAAIVFFRSLGVLDDRGLHPEGVIPFSEEDLHDKLGKAGISGEVGSKIFLLVRLYQEVVKKYSCACGGGKAPDAVPALCELMARLKDLREIVLSPAKTDPEESFYFKRHIAFGIPSVMGSYHEPKFDALGAALRNEENARIFMEEVISRVTEAEADLFPEEVRAWIDSLAASDNLFTFHDQRNFQVEELLAIMKACKLRLSQVIDMLRMWQKELTWMVEFFPRTFHDPLVKILKAFPQDELPDHLKGLRSSDLDFIDKATDLIIRDMMNSVAGFLELDRLLGSVMTALRRRVLSGADDEIIPPEAEEPKADYYMLDALTEMDAMLLAPFIGGKAKDLVYLRTKGLRVPPGAVFSTALAQHYQDYTRSSAFDAALRKAVRAIEEKTGTVYGGRMGGKERPLFLSVRSGSYISMPGILSSVLFCGMNDLTHKAFLESKGDAWLVWDSLRRFIEDYGTVVFGLDIKFFDEIAEGVSKRKGEFRRDEIAVAQLEEVVRRYRDALQARGLPIPDDVFEQLKECVRAVYASWYSERSRQFRKAMEVSGYWGTSVTLMEMVYGNARGAGASVFFTRRPVTLEKEIYGDTMKEVTGVDLVYGRYVNRPISRRQSPYLGKSLEETDPVLFGLHSEAASKIEEAMGGLPQEVEITYTKDTDDGKVLHVLQTRRMEFHRGFTKRFSDVCRMQSRIIGRGAGVHGGALSGIVTFATSPEQIRKLKEVYGMPVILLRNTASTEDVSLMPEIDGIITAGGGVASHASVLAQKFGLTAVVGCSGMELKVDEQGVSHGLIGGHGIIEGTAISMDGSTGLIYSGVCSDFE
jgi:pyruvate,orthophosphate dikinase